MARVPLPSIGLLLLFFVSVSSVEVKAAKSSSLKRQKREWIIPPQKLTENVDYTKKEYIAKIRSDKQFLKPVRYSLSGVGATEDPMNLFVVDPETGFVRITGILDREKIHMYNLSGVARYLDGEYAEKNIDLRIQVVDQNDCKPKFSAMSPGSVYELSPTETFIMKINATDDDEPGNINSKIAYSIVSQEPKGEQMFFLRKNGDLFVRRPTLDRETQESYTLVIQGADLDGAVGGNVGTGTVTVKVLDVNDNIPTLDKDRYEGSIDENAQNVEVMRFQALDKDTDFENQLAEFEIVSGNEAGYFTIATDPKTNEGVLTLNKPVDYEELQDLDLQVVVKNKAPYHPSIAGSAGGGGGGSGAGGGGAGGGGAAGGGGGGGAGGGGGGGGGSTSWSSKTYPVKINVKNMPEGPKFNPKVKAVPISEDGKSVNLKDVIVRYPAIDGDTMKDAENVRYVKGFDPDNWLVIDEKTAEVRLNKLPDRESKHLVNGTYYAKILCMTQDMPSKTATGTIALQVADFNDHCPELTSTSQSVCSDEKVAFVTAHDIDAYPNGAPFQFSIIPEETKGEWTVERLNDTSAILRAHENLWPGPYEVTLEITDQQGHACPDRQVMKVEVCTCDKNQVCGTRGGSGGDSPGAVFGAPGIGLLFLGLLTLLLVPLLLLFCNCGGGAGGIGGGFADLPYDTKEHLISYHTEGKGEDKEVPLLNAPLDMGGGYLQSQNLLGSGAVAMDTFQASASTMGGRGGFYYPPSGRVEVDYMEDMIGQEHVTGFQSAFESSEGHMYDGIALPEPFLGDYYSQKSRADAHPTKESLLVYDYEGQGSLAGSVGCCSLLEADNSLEFLNDLDPKFKTLAEICKQPEPEPKVTITPPKPVTMEHSATSVHTTNTVNVTRSSPPPPQVTNTERNVIIENNYTATLPKVNVRENVVVPSQTYLVQQPMYYATAPVLQATRYVMEPQVQGMYVVGEAPVTENMVLQERRVMSGPAVHGGVIGVQQGTLNRGENVVLVERNVGPGQVVREGAPGVVQMGNLSGSQIMLVEGQMGAGQVLQGGQSWIQQGTLQRGPISGSQNIVLVERQGGAGQVLQEGMSQTQSIIHEGPMLSPGLNGGSFHMGTLPGSHKIVVKEKKIVSG